MTTELTIQTLAAEVRKQFTKDTRTDGSVFWKRTSNAEDWVQQLCMDAHGDMMPDDYRYAFIVESLDEIMSFDDIEDVDMESDCSTNELTAWLASRADRQGYCDEALEEYGGLGSNGIIQLIAWGQYREKREVLDSVRASLESRLEELEDQADDDETDDGDEASDDEPSGPEEDDWVTEDHILFRAYNHGRCMFIVPNGEDWRTALKARMDADRFYPNVWFISDHGNAHLLSLDSDD